MKKSLVNKVFNEVAENYDLMNDLMSFGLHRSWKKEFIEQIKKKNTKILDIGSGTGDIVSQILKRKEILNANFKIFLSDPNYKMINEGKKKVINNNKLFWVSNYAENLPFKNNFFDLITMSFSLRNVHNLNKSLSEIKRVLKKNGQFLCLEFGKVENTHINNIYKLYSNLIIPNVGGIVTKSKESYEYLINSIKKFPSQELLIKILKKKGYKRITYKNLSFGIVAIYSSFK